ncbi:MAG: T9SS type A sorting domain-containing protein [Bacteroidia bacterium]
MIKRFLLGALFIGTISSINAQTVVVSSNFSAWTNNLPDGWMGSKTNIEFNTPYDSVLQVNSGVVYGTAAVRLVNAGTSHKRFTTQAVSVSQGQTYEAKFWVKGKGDIRLGLFDNDLSNGDFGYTYASYISVNSTAWTMYTQTVTADTTYNMAEFILSLKATDANFDHLEIDSIAIYTATAPPPPPPTCIQSNFSSWTNGIPNGWKGSRTNFDFQAPYDSIVEVTSGAVYGTSAVRLINPGTSHVRFSSQATPVTQGQAYEARFWVRGKGDIRFGLYDNDQSNGDFGYTYAPYLTINSATWTMQTQQVVADTNFNTAEFILSFKATDAAQNHLEIDSISICPVTQSLTSVYNIQYTTDPNGNSPFANSTVLTGGIVTAIHSTGFFIQSGTGPYSGIFVFNNTNTPNRGDSVTFSAQVEEYFGMTQLKNVSNFTIVNSGNNVAPTVVTTAQAGTEAYEGVLVKVEFATCSNANAGFGEWTVWNSPTSINIDDMIFPFTPTQGAAYDITGPVYYSFSTYKILPRDANDIVLVSQVGMKENGLDNIKVYPNPASEFVMIENTLQSDATVLIYDMRGALIKQLELTSSSERISISDLTSGMYHIRVSSSQGLAQYKLVIQK